MPSKDEELVGYILCEMLNAEQTAAFCRQEGIKVPSGSRSSQCRVVAAQTKLAALHAFCIANWERPSAAIHIENLKSGKLNGFSWHNLAPSRLHLGLQGHVRRVATGQISLDAFLALGADVIHKEYVMVAVADLTELTLVERCGATPPLRARSVSDVVLGGYPFDVKNGSIPNGWTAASIRNDPKAFAAAMIAGADSERLRKEANKAFNAWANNRLFVNTEHEERWLDEPEACMNDLAAAASKLTTPFRLTVADAEVLTHVIVI
ncbi:MAG: hypothetical protein KF689_12980 [Gemmatimonadaceae bacterium]|nr:hypothetical protein [Gemmatimonadaceae bacterium]MCW5827102.1 hypothetical protein [Gemmatimonadaceae bacterium]